MLPIPSGTLPDMSHSLNSLKGDTRSLDNGTYKGLSLAGQITATSPGLCLNDDLYRK